VSQIPPDTKATVKILRAGKEKTFNVKLGELPANEIAARNAPDGWGRKGDAFEGVQMADPDPRTRRQYDIPGNLRGALVIDIDPNSTAFAAGLRQGDVIVEINRKAVNDVDDLTREARSQSGSLLLRVWGQSGSRYVVLNTTKPKH
jgi:serine protease Do